MELTFLKKANYKFGSCWGAGVYANGHFKRTTSKTPILKEPLTDEIIK